MTADIGKGIAFIAGLAVLALIFGTLVPAQFSAVNIDNTQILLNMSEGETENVFRTVNATALEVTTTNVTVQLKDTRTNDVNTTKINETETETVTLRDYEINITAVSLQPPTEVDLTFTYPGVYPLSDSAVTILEVFQSFLLSVFVFLIFGGIFKITGLI